MAEVTPLHTLHSPSPRVEFGAFDQLFPVKLSDRSGCIGRGSIVQWIFLLGAIAAEVFATTSLKFSEGFTKLLPSIFVVAGYSTAFFLLSQSLVRGMDLGVAYGLWAALGVALVAIIGVVFLGESLTWVQTGGIALLIAGVMALEMGGQH